MKQTIRLNEVQLKSVIAEAVKRVLNEDFDKEDKNKPVWRFSNTSPEYDMNSPEYQQMYDSGVKRWYDGRDDANTRKEIDDYESLPNKVRHPNIDISYVLDRIKNRDWKSADRLAQKQPNSILQMQQDKREFEQDLENTKHNFAFSRWCHKNGLSRENLTDNDIVNLYRDFLEEKFEEEERRREYEDY